MSALGSEPGPGDDPQEPSSPTRRRRRRRASLSGDRKKFRELLLEAFARQQLPDQPADEGAGDEGRKQRPARLQHQLVADVVDGLEGDQRQEQAEGDQAGESRRRAARARSPGARRLVFGSPRRAISDLLDFRAAEQALRQEDHHHDQDRERGDVLVVGREVGRPERLDQADERARRSRRRAASRCRRARRR